MMTNSISSKINRETSSNYVAPTQIRSASAPTLSVHNSAPLSLGTSSSADGLARENLFQRYPNVSKDDLEQIIEDIIDDKNLSINKFCQKLFVAFADNDEEHFLRSFLQSQNKDIEPLNFQVLKENFKLLDSALQTYMKDKNQEPIDNTTRIGVWIDFLMDEEKLRPYRGVKPDSSFLSSIPEKDSSSSGGEHPVKASSVVTQQIERGKQSLLAQVLFGNLGQGLLAEEQVAVYQKVNGQGNGTESTQVTATASCIQQLAVRQVNQAYQQRGMELSVPEPEATYRLLTQGDQYQKKPDLRTTKEELPVGSEIKIMALEQPNYQPPIINSSPINLIEETFDVPDGELPPPIIPAQLDIPEFLTKRRRSSFTDPVNIESIHPVVSSGNFTNPLSLVFGANNRANHLSLNSDFYEQVGVEQTLPDFILGVVANSVYGTYQKNDDRAVLLTSSDKIFISAIDGVGSGSNSGFVANLLAEEMVTYGGDTDSALVAVNDKLKNKSDLGQQDGALFAAAKIYKNDLGELMLSATSIGDSQVMVFDRDGSLKFESSMHNYVLQAEKEGNISKQEAMSNSKRGVVFSSVRKDNSGIKDCFREDICLSSGDIILVMTDGVTDNLHRDEIQDIIKQNRGGIKEIFETIGSLVEEQMRSVNNKPSVDTWDEKTETFPNGRTLLPKGDNVTLLAIQCA